MKTIGFIGGMSWESSAEYYRILNEQIRERLGGQHSARILLYSIDFEPLSRYQHAGDWEGALRLMMDAARRLERGGADLILIGANTMHKLFDDLQAGVSIPILHIADALARVIIDQGLKDVGLLGTKFTMEEDFYRSRLQDRHGIGTIIPDTLQRVAVHRIIYEELCLGVVKDDSKRDYLTIIQDLVERGAEGIVLGCTEIPMLVSQKDVSIPMFDTTRIHAEAAVDLALKD